MGSVGRIARGAVEMVVDYVLPPRCPSCGAILGEDHSFCLPCWQQLTFLGDPCCSRCGLPFPYEQPGGAECGACLASEPSFDRLRAAVTYGDTSRQVALRLKYGRRPGVARTLARFMARHAGDEGESLIVPVPLHRWRLWNRGYNQAALIGRALASRTGARFEPALLERTRATPTMRGLSRTERARIVRGAFRVAPRHAGAVEGRTILLVDDIYTTGATANACARALRKAGAARVNILCWARVVRTED